MWVSMIAYMEWDMPPGLGRGSDLPVQLNFCSRFVLPPFGVPGSGLKLQAGSGLGDIPVAYSTNFSEGTRKGDLDSMLAHFRSLLGIPC